MKFLAMLPPTARAMGWRSALITAPAGVVIAGVPVLFSAELQLDDLATILRLIAATGVLSVGFLLHDPASTVSSITPTSRLTRHLVRVFWIGAAAVPWWILVLVLVRSSAGADLRPVLPLAGLTVEAVAILGIALVTAVGAQRLGVEEHMGLITALAVLVSVVVVVSLPSDMAVVVSPSDPRFNEMRVWWALTSLLSAMAFLGLAREPAPYRSREPRAVGARRRPAVDGRRRGGVDRPPG